MQKISLLRNSKSPSVSFFDAICAFIKKLLGKESFISTLFGNPAMIISAGFVLFLIFLAILAPWLAPYDPIEQFRFAVKVPPFWQSGGSSQFLLGTDEVGRDIFSRLIYGTRLSMLISLGSVVMSMVPGIIFGFLAAFYPRWIGVLVMRLMDVLLALPALLLAVAIVAVLGPGLKNTMLAVALVGLPSYTRLSKVAADAELKKDYVMAAHISGARSMRVMFYHVLPNCSAPLIVQATLGVSNAILDTAALGFLGLGVQPPEAEWGTMLSSARDYIVGSWWIIAMPGLAILTTVIAINLLGDGLRDALDPRLKRTR